MQRETTSREFLEWQEYLDKEEWTKHHRDDYYMAQIACEVARRRVKDPGSLKIEHFLIKFAMTEKDQTPISQEEMDKRTAWSKAKWFGITGAGMARAPTAAPPDKRPPARKR